MATRRKLKKYEAAFLDYMLNCSISADIDADEVVFMRLAKAWHGLCTKPLKSPRLRLTQSFLDSSCSFWQKLQNSENDTAFMAILGVPHFLFSDLAELVRPHLPQYDHSITRRGRTSTLSHEDVLGVVLRYTQVSFCCFLDL